MWAFGAPLPRPPSPGSLLSSEGRSLAWLAPSYLAFKRHTHIDAAVRLKTQLRSTAQLRTQNEYEPLFLRLSAQGLCSTSCATQGESRCGKRTELTTSQKRTWRMFSGAEQTGAEVTELFLSSSKSVQC